MVADPLPTPCSWLQAWRAAMPRVAPFYAVKCNPEPGMLRFLVAMGTGFDCASKGELEMMLQLGVPPSRIIFAHPCKRASDIRYAREHGVQYTTVGACGSAGLRASYGPAHMQPGRLRTPCLTLTCKYWHVLANPCSCQGPNTALLACLPRAGMFVLFVQFDTVSELRKIAQLNPEFKLVLRIRADDPDARVPLGLKYGAEVSEAPGLLRAAKELGLQVVGTSFHVGSAAKNLATFTNAVENCRKVFDEAEALGFNMELLDIGGGFTGHFDAFGNVEFGEIATTINAALAMYFPPDSGVRVIAEPGRYFAETSSTLLTPVYGQRNRIAKDGSTHKDYWLTDGLYGSFNCM